MVKKKKKMGGKKDGFHCVVLGVYYDRVEVRFVGNPFALCLNIL